MTFETVLFNQFARFEACSAEQIHCAPYIFGTRIGTFGERSRASASPNTLLNSEIL